jgi:predicted ATP-binding protein involved in virulence
MKRYITFSKLECKLSASQPPSIGEFPRSTTSSNLLAYYSIVALKRKKEQEQKKDKG